MVTATDTDTSGTPPEAPATGAGTLSVAPAPDAPPAATDKPWYDGISGELRDWTELKGWKNQEAALSSAWNLEKLMGADKAGRTLMLPKEGEPKDDLFNKLGRPETSAEYKLEGEGDLVDWFKDVAHKSGFSQDQADGFYKELSGMLSSKNEAEETQKAQQSETDFNDLKKEWGLAYDQNVQAGKLAAQRFGFTSEELDGMESALGTKALMQRMAAIGRAMGEDNFDGPDSGNSGGFGMTPAAAKQQIAEMKMDSNFTSAYMDPSHAGHSEAKAKMERIMAAAYPEGV